MQDFQCILVTGATGYIGGRLVPRLLEAGYPVRVLVRDPSRLLGRSWLDEVEVAQGDVLKPRTLSAAMAGVDAAYYSDPQGLLGLLYWNMFHPVHTLVFSGLIRAVARQAEGRSTRPTATALS